MPKSDLWEARGPPLAGARTESKDNFPLSVPLGVHLVPSGSPSRLQSQGSSEPEFPR